MKIKNAQKLSQILDQVEAELKRIGRWDETLQAPEPGSAAPFGGATLSFEQWLQAVFLPNARASIAAGEGPDESYVGVAAMRNFDGDDQADQLASLLGDFDEAYEKNAKR